MIGFVVAMEKEARLVLDRSDIIDRQVLAGKNIVKGRFCGKEFVLIIAGIGKVNAGMATQILIDNYSVERLVNFGLAGGKQGSGLSAGDVVQVGKVCQYDFDLSELDEVSVGYMQDYDLIYFPAKTSASLASQYKVVTCATGDRFTSKKIYLDTVRDLGAQVVDMESGAIAQVAFANGVDVSILKIISDVDGKYESIYSQYASNNAEICRLIPDAIELLFNNL